MTDEALAHLHTALGALDGLEKRIKARTDIKRAPETQIACEALARATAARGPDGPIVRGLPGNQAIEAPAAALVGHRQGGRGAVRPAADGGAGGAD